MSADLPLFLFSVFVLPGVSYPNSDVCFTDKQPPPPPLRHGATQESSQGSHSLFLSVFLFLLSLRLSSLFVDSPKCILLPGQHANPRQERCPIEANFAKNGSRHIVLLAFLCSALPPLSVSLLTPVPKTWRQEDKVEETQSGQESDPTPAVKRSPCTFLIS